MRTTTTTKLLALALLSVSACTSTPPILPQRDFDRPTDVTFVCVGAFTATGATPPDGGAPAGADGGTLVLSGRPMRECHPRTETDPAPDAQHRTFVFLPNSNSGELGVVDADTWKLVDLDPKIAGFNQAPLGVLPEQIASSDDGCRVVTANHGSCDLTVVDPAALLAPTLHAAYAEVPPSTGAPIFTRVQPRTSSGRVLPLAPRELAFVPSFTKAMDPPGGRHLCRADWSGRAIATFPSCNLVALLDLPSGKILDSYRLGLAGGSVAFEHTGAEPVCPVADCGGAPAPVTVDASAAEASAVDASAVEASAVDASAVEASVTDASATDADGASSDADAVEAGPPPAPPTPTSARRPTGLAINPETMRAYVGLADAPFVVAFDVSAAGLAKAGGPAGDGVIPLTADAIGSNRLRLSIDPYLEKTSGAVSGSFVGTSVPTTEGSSQSFESRKYLYVVARDGTVRVVEVADQIEHECETNADPVFTAAAGLSLDDACLPVDPLPPKPKIRRTTAVGPGIRTPSPPIDVAASDVGTRTDHSETSVGGAFAWILAANGNVYLANINPVRRATAAVEDNGDVNECLTPAEAKCRMETPPPPNTLRDRNVLSYSRALDSSTGPPRLEFAPTAGVTGPRIQNVWTRGTDDNATAVSNEYLRTGVFFPKDAQPQAQTWAVTWEGSLLATPRFSGQIIVQPNLTWLVDYGMDFCRAGLRKGDLVTVRGCADDTECGLGKVCMRGTEGTQGAGGLAIGGLCLPKDAKPGSCDALLRTVRRYDALPMPNKDEVQVDRVRLAPHKDELVLPLGVHCRASTTADGGVDGGADASGADGSVADAAPDAPSDAAADAASLDGGAATPGAAGLAALSPVCSDPTDPSTSKFQCMPSGQCLQPCTKPGESTTCRAGRICVEFPPEAPAEAGSKPCLAKDGKTPTCFCSDGPDLAKADATSCLGELLPYTLQVGGGFLVSGSQSGVPITRLPNADGVCTPLEVLDPSLAAVSARAASRISPKDGPWCAPPLDEPNGGFDNRCNPNVIAAKDPKDRTNADIKCLNDVPALQKQAADQAFAPNPCLFLGGPNETDAPSVGSAQHVQALFRNNELRFMMTNLEQPLSGTFQIRFDVSGGFRAQFVGVPGTVEIGMPARIVTSPFDSRATGSNEGNDVPYLFVVDQRRLGRAQGSSAARGQLLRIHPRGNAVTTPKAGSQPLYEDLTHSNNLFPIQ